MNIYLKMFFMIDSKSIVRKVGCLHCDNSTSKYFWREADVLGVLLKAK